MDRPGTSDHRYDNDGDDRAFEDGSLRNSQNLRPKADRQ